MRHAAGRGKKPNRLLLVRPKGMIDRAFPNGVCFQFSAEISDGGADLVVVCVMQRNGLLRGFGAEGPCHFDESDFVECGFSCAIEGIAAFIADKGKRTPILCGV